MDFSFPTSAHAVQENPLDQMNMINEERVTRKWSNFYRPMVIVFVCLWSSEYRMPILVKTTANLQQLFLTLSS